ncbi:precorrin-6Y C5,15-methyltransferase (decarboxylating) [Azospirillaceae bacterium]
MAAFFVVLRQRVEIVCSVWDEGRVMTAWLNVVGIGEDGLSGLGGEARRIVLDAKVLIGGQRHLDMIPEVAMQERLQWPKPFSSAYEMVLAWRGVSVCVLASGDPMMCGVGVGLWRLVDPEEIRVFPAPSSFSLAAARLGWPLQDVVLLSVHGRPLTTVLPHLRLGARLLVLSENGRSPAQLARLLAQRGFGASRIIVLERMGGIAERRLEGIAEDWPYDDCADLNVTAVACRAEAEAGWAETQARVWSSLAGLPDEAYQHDGQLTKRDVRAMTLARLAPKPGEALWDVGAGCGSIGIEWARSHPSCCAVAVESDVSRGLLIERNRAALEAWGVKLVIGRAPGVLEGLEAPDAVFIGGGG